MIFFYVLFYVCLLVRIVIFCDTYGYAFLKHDRCVVCSVEKDQSNKYNDKLLLRLLLRQMVGCGSFDCDISYNSDCDRCYVFVADCCGVVKKLDINTGKCIWSKRLSNVYLKKSHWLPASCNSSLLLSTNIVVNKDCCYIGTGLSEVYALDANTGKISWAVSVSGEVISRPVVSHGVVLVYTNNGFFHALDEHSGIIKWTVHLDIPSKLSLLVTPLPVVSSGIVVFGDITGMVSACDINNGELIWQKKISNLKGLTDIDRLSDVVAPKIVGDTVYAIAYNGNMVALDLSSGSLFWSMDIGSLMNIIIEDGIIYLIDQESRIFALNASTGTIIWNKQSWMHYQLSPILLYKDYVLFGDAKGYLYWLHKKDGALFRKDKVASGHFNQPLIIFNKMIICEKSGIMSVWDLIKYN